MVKSKTVYVCQKCDSQFPRWQGQCSECGAWNSLVESITVSKIKGLKSSLETPNIAVFLNNVKSIKSEVRTQSGIGEFDRVLGGGFVSGQVVLLSGDPGIGKSTLLLQLSASLNVDSSSDISELSAERTGIKNHKFQRQSSIARKVATSKTVSTLYISGEESPEQIKLRADRLGVDQNNIKVLAETNVDNIISILDTGNLSPAPGLIIVDSVQTLATTDLAGTAGSVGQVKESANRLIKVAKNLQIPVILAGHVTKEGAIAGPKVLEHMVDTVLYMEGDKNHLFRILKTTKNRFGPVSEVGVFSMGDKGLVEIKNPSDVFLEERLPGVSGSVVTVVMEGTRPVALEIQALTTKTSFGYPRRTISGYSLNRLNLLCAVLQKRAGIKIYDQDVYVNVAGGVKIEEPAADLAICLAIASSVTQKNVNSRTAVFGEVGLSGEIRNVSRIDDRIKEAKRLGFSAVINAKNVKSVGEAVKNLF